MFDLWRSSQLHKHGLVQPSCTSCPTLHYCDPSLLPSTHPCSYKHTTYTRYGPGHKHAPWVANPPATMPPKVLQKNKDNSNTPKDNSNNSNKNSNNHNHNHSNPLPSARNAPKTPTTRLKLEIRRLPPGLTLSEFEETLGEEWKPGKGRVDWREFRQGKIPGSRNASASAMGGSGKKCPSSAGAMCT